MKRLPWHILAITIITAVAAWLRLANLGAINFYNDEYYHVNTAVGYLKTGEFKQYNFYTEQVEQPYTRAKIFTWQVAQSFNWFGISEASARLPALMWGVILIPLVIVILLKSTKNGWIAYGTGVWLAFDNFFIDQARFTRMYTMVSVLTVLSLFFLYQYFTVKSKRARYGYGIAFAITLLLNWLIFKELTLALLAGLAVYISLRTVIFFIKRRVADRMFVYWWIVGAGTAVTLIGLRLLGFNSIPLDAAKVLTVPHWTYAWYMVDALRLPICGAIGLGCGLVVVRQYRSFMALPGIVVSAILVYFIFLSRHEEAKRYISFIIPLAYSLMVFGLYTIMHSIAQRSRWRKKTATIVMIWVIALTGPKLSWPGFPADGFIVQAAVSDKTYRDLNRSDVKTAYQYVADHFQTGDSILIQGPRYYYWPDKNMPVQELGHYKSLSFDEFIDLTQSSGTGVWVVYSQQRQRHLLPEIRQYIKENFTKVDTLDDTLVNVYYKSSPSIP